MNEAYIRDAVVHRLIPLPVDMEDVHAEHMEKPLQVDHSNLSSLKKTLDAFALKHGFVVKQMYRTTSNAKWACRPKLKSAQQEDERADTTCIFSVNANVRKAGGVYITSMNLNHNHALQTDDDVESVDISSIEAQAVQDLETSHGATLDDCRRGDKRPHDTGLSGEADGSGTSWTRNLLRHRDAASGFWGDSRWYDLQITRRLPLVPRMLDEIVWAMPPIGPSHRVADLCAGSGACSEKVLAAYPDIEIVLFDGAKDRLDLAVQRLRATVSSSSSRAISFHVADLNKISILRKAPFDVIVASLAVHVLVERPAHDCHPSSSTPPRRNDKEAEHKRVFQLMFNSLSPNGHVLLGDHVGQASLFSHLKWMEDVGFVDVDCAWRQDDFFVIGGRRPPHLRGQLVL
ncbi:hypothetical protein H310_00567 [Aphanomyces invadans]|uniref:Methyltransferase domain-containing protein n=1 Tax=Aphanomyces invadans TaxID=157072 RepID=A0A024UV26_9STRA|nr:hypothetical protein H310_00567 [Aphanomyces invadans]ETW10204.1 hypothetical protein H310_00567 [Aphanomyces invadans]|eukprot:XP_008861615.1 hypothetical protein H310_00567 [Aphanomyces invadans]